MTKPNIKQIQIPSDSLKILIPIVYLAYSKKVGYENCDSPTAKEIKPILDILLYEWAQTQ